MNAIAADAALPRTQRAALAPVGLLVLVLLPLLLMPLAAIFIFAFGGGLSAFWHALRTPDAQFALRFSLLIAFSTAIVNAVLGTSGSGKSTILRLIAGLTQPDAGRITLDGRDVTTLSPQQRGTGFVFQNYSIFRPMSVAENIEFGLKIRRMPSAERAERRDQLLDLVGLAGMGNRHADQLSGGQQQRVALARALAYRPTVLLLDEPFGALDAKTRTQLRRSLKEVQKQLGVTTILVTHDQDEAFELADRIGVLDHGRLLEVGGAETLYASPKTLFGATFLGAGTVLVGQVHEEQAHFGPLVLPIPPEVPHEDGSPVQVLFRPEQVSLSVEKPTDQMAVLGRGAISEQYFTGALRRVQIRLPRLQATRQIAPPVPFGEEDMSVDAVIPSEIRVVTHDLWVSLRGWHILEQPDLRLLGGFESEVTSDGTAGFLESGTITFGEGGHRLRFSTVGQGYISSSPEPNLKHGCVIWQVEGGEGQFAGAKGLITSNLTVGDAGEVIDNQLGVLFLQ